MKYQLLQDNSILLLTLLSSVGHGLDADAKEILSPSLRSGQRRSSRTKTGVSEHRDLEAIHHPADVECSIQFESSCQIFKDGESIGSCDTFTVPLITVETCQYTPLTAALLYNGGDCSQSDNVDLLGITCEDGVAGTPPTQDGEVSYITVTDANNQGLVYWEGSVAVGQEYMLRGDPLLDHGFNIQIYDSDDMSNLLQRVSYPASLCSNDMEMLNRFGGSQIVGYSNVLQGAVKPFKAVNFDEYEVNVDLLYKSTATEDVAVDQFSVTTNFGGQMELSDLLAGQILSPGSSMSVQLPVENVNLIERQRHTMLVRAIAGPCVGVDFLIFHTGGQYAG